MEDKDNIGRFVKIAVLVLAVKYTSAGQTGRY